MEAAAGTVDVRRAEPDDAATVLTMVRELAAHEGDASDVVGTPETWAQMLARPEVVVLVAERDGEPAGYVSTVRKRHLWRGEDDVAAHRFYRRLGATLRTKVVALWQLTVDGSCTG